MKRPPPIDPDQLGSECQVLVAEYIDPDGWACLMVDGQQMVVDLAEMFELWCLMGSVLDQGGTITDLFRKSRSITLEDFCNKAATALAQPTDTTTDDDGNTQPLQ